MYLNRRVFIMVCTNWVADVGLKYLTYCRLNELPYTVLEDFNFDFRYVRLCDLDIPREK